MIKKASCQSAQRARGETTNGYKKTPQHALAEDDSTECCLVHRWTSRRRPPAALTPKRRATTLCPLAEMDRGKNVWWAGVAAVMTKARVGAALFWVAVAFAGLGTTLAVAQTFDRESCDRWRENANDVLADMMRTDGAPSNKARACLVRIAFLRLGDLNDTTYAEDGAFQLAYQARTRDYRVREDDPYPSYFLRDLADQLVTAQPAAVTDSVFKNNLQFSPITQDGTDWLRSEADPPAVASTAGDLAGPSTPPPADVEAQTDALQETPPAIVTAHRLPKRKPALPPATQATVQDAAVTTAQTRATDTCLNPAQSSDRDVTRNRSAIEAAGLCLTRATIREGARPFTFVTITNPQRPDGPAWYLPHDNESEAFDAAVYAVAKYGGAMVAIDGGETRFYRSIDPNRFFGRDASNIRACKMRAPTPTYTDFVMAAFNGRAEVLSIHNNTRGGSVSVNVWSDKEKGFPARGRLSDPDHLVYIAGARPFADDPRAKRQLDALITAGLNVVHEFVRPGNNDCSLSNFVVLSDGRPYYNIEAVHGSKIQREMVDRLLGMLGHRPIGNS